MVVVVDGLPVGSADIAELVSTSALHMVASLVLLNYYSTLPAPLVLPVVLEEVDLVLVAVSLVLFHQTVTAKPPLALFADHSGRLDVLLFDDAFTVLSWTHFD